MVTSPLAERLPAAVQPAAAGVQRPEDQAAQPGPEHAPPPGGVVQPGRADQAQRQPCQGDRRVDGALAQVGDGHLDQRHGHQHGQAPAPPGAWRQGDNERADHRQQTLHQRVGDEPAVPPALIIKQQSGDGARRPAQAPAGHGAEGRGDADHGAQLRHSRTDRGPSRVPAAGIAASGSGRCARRPSAARAAADAGSSWTSSSSAAVRGPPGPGRRPVAHRRRLYEASHNARSRVRIVTRYLVAVARQNAT
jgi:hypothetical protein